MVMAPALYAPAGDDWTTSSPTLSGAAPSNPAPYRPSGGHPHVLRSPASGSALCGALVREVAVVRADHADHAGARHRRLHGDLLDGQRHPAAAAAAARPRPPGVRDRDQRQRKEPGDLDLGAELLRLAESQPLVRSAGIV